MAETGQVIGIKSGSSDLAYLTLFFFCGILAGSALLPRWPVMAGSFLLSALILFINRRNKANLKAALMLAVFLAGVFDYEVSYISGSRLDIFDGKSVVYQCLIMDRPVDKGGYLQYTARVLSVEQGGKYYNYSGKVFLQMETGREFRFGDRVSVEGQCTDIAGKRNPGDFDYRLYYRSKGIVKTIKAGRAALLRENSAGAFRTMLYLSKEKVRAAINKALPAEEAAMLVGIITGDKADIDEDTREAYIRTGLSHILSVSGLHVGFLMLLLTCLLKPLRLEKKLQGFIIILVITYYVLLIGAPLPSVRALVMLAVLVAGKAVGRNYDLLASVSFAAIVILVWKPLAVHDPGFMISFGAMYSIAFLYSAFYSLLRCVPSVIRGTAALSLSVSLGLAPLLVCYFNYISVISVIINIVAVPLSMIITIAGFIGVLVGIVSMVPAVYIFSVDYYLIRLLNLIVREASELPFAGFYIPSLPVYIYLLYYAGIALWIGFLRTAFCKAYIGRLSMAYLLAVAAALSVYSLPSGELRMFFFDVGQGDSCCIVTPMKRAVLVDGGGSSGRGDYYYDIGGKITLPALLHQGIWRIDTCIVSHLHDDHMEGLLSVMEVYPVKNLIIPEASGSPESVSANSSRLLEMCRRKGVGVYRLGRGDYINIGKEVRIDFLNPGEKADADENENSLVGVMTYGGFRALLTGDIGKETEAELLSYALESSVLKVPHHGSGGSSSEEFLEAVRPKVSIVSAGKNNIYGHPSPDTLQRLEDAGSLIYRTDESGAVIISTDGKRMKVRTVR